jgi:hypothetical protein
MKIKKKEREQERGHWERGAAAPVISLASLRFSCCAVPASPVSCFQFYESNFLRFLLPGGIFFPFYFVLSSAADARGLLLLFPRHCSSSSPLFCSSFLFLLFLLTGEIFFPVYFLLSSAADARGLLLLSPLTLLFLLTPFRFLLLFPA